jgi:hypothetical protein
VYYAQGGLTEQASLVTGAMMKRMITRPHVSGSAIAHKPTQARQTTTAQIGYRRDRIHSNAPVYEMGQSESSDSGPSSRPYSPKCVEKLFGK